jgi:hypothetical protein
MAPRFDNSIKRGVAEFTGICTLVVIGVGAIIAASEIDDPSLIGIALAPGLASRSCVSAHGDIGGAPLRHLYAPGRTGARRAGGERCAGAAPGRRSRELAPVSA